MKYPTLLIFSMLLLFISCGDDDSADCSSAASTELSGTVLERPFSLQTARAIYDEDEDDFQIQMFADDDIVITDVCGSLGTILIGSQITFFVNNTNEVREFGGTKIVTLYHAATMEFETTTSGCYTVDEITNTSVSGALSLLNDDGSQMVSGTWSAVICN